MSIFSRPLIVVFYAINGVGLGHVTRLLAIAKRLRAQTSQSQKTVIIVFVTSSEGDQRLFDAGFLSFKVPALRLITSGSPWSEYPNVAGRILKDILEALGPDLVVIDGHPSGSFGELLPTRSFSLHDCCGKVAFVYRPVRTDTSERPAFVTMMETFDSIIIPERIEPIDVVDDPRVRCVGPILNIDEDSLLTKREARSRIDIDYETFTVYVSTGGGGHKDAEHQIRTIVASLATLPNILLIVAAGPLYRGSRPNSQNIKWFNDVSGVCLMAACDVAVSAAGANSYGELMHLGVPTVFVPLRTTSDDQESRAREAEQAGAAFVVPLDEIPEKLASIVQSLRNPLLRNELSQQAKKTVPQNGADYAAEVLYELLMNKDREVT